MSSTTDGSARVVVSPNWLDLTGGHLSQDPSHDLTGPRLGKTGNELKLAGRGDGSDFLPDMGHQVFFQLITSFITHLKYYVGIKVFPLNVMRETDDGRFGYVGMGNQRTLNLGRADPVAGNIHHVVNTAHQPEVTVFILSRPVSGKVKTGLLDKIGIVKSLRFFIDGSASGPAMIF